MAGGKKRNLWEIIGFKDNNGDGKTNLGDIFGGKKQDPKPEDKKNKWMLPAGIATVAVAVMAFFTFSGGKKTNKRKPRR
jgi:hypothetical protein